MEGENTVKLLDPEEVFSWRLNPKNDIILNILLY